MFCKFEIWLTLLHKSYCKSEIDAFKLMQNASLALIMG